jgi:hypothetical protein
MIMVAANEAGKTGVSYHAVRFKNSVLPKSRPGRIFGTKRRGHQRDSLINYAGGGG